MKLLQTAVIWCTAIQVVFSRSVNAGRTLVVGDNVTPGSGEYKQLFSQLESLAGDDSTKIDYKSVSDESIELIQYDADLKYDTLVLLPIKPKSLGPKLTSKKLLDYFEKGGNILAVTSKTSVPESLREFAAQLDIFLAPKGYALADHFIGQGSKHDGVLLGTANWADQPIIDTQAMDGEVIYGGSGAYLGNNPQAIPLVHAPSTSYLYDAREEDNEFMGTPWAQGTQISLSAAFQGRHSNSRFAWLGDAELVKSKASTAAKQLVHDIVSWTGQEKGVIRASDVKHFVAENKKNETSDGHELYQMREKVAYQVTISQWDGNTWGTFDTEDIQLEFVMLDPYYRINLEKLEDKPDGTVYGTKFTTPDQYGMFTFKLEYLRSGLSFIDERQVVTVRHTANDEWPRSWSIPNSWIYLTSSISVVIGWFLFVIFYLYSEK